MSSDSADQSPIDPESWPVEGGRPFARGWWANLGPYLYRDRKWRIATRVAVVLVFAWMLFWGIFGLWSAFRSATEPDQPVPTAPTLPAPPGSK